MPNVIQHDCCLSPETLRQFLANELGEVQEASVEAQLETCASCQEACDRVARQGQFHRVRSHMANLEREAEASGLSALRDQLYQLDDTASQRASLCDTEGESLPLLSQDPTQVGRFLIEQRLGAGGFGVVLLAQDPILNRQVALKVARTLALADSDQRGRFVREAQAAAALHHPHIVPVYEAGEADGVYYLTADYVPGPNLAQWFAEQPGPLPAKPAARLLLALAEAVEHAHQNGILHRDIKPGNVLMDPRGHGSPHAPREDIRSELAQNNASSVAPCRFHHAERDD